MSHSEHTCKTNSILEFALEILDMTRKLFFVLGNLDLLPQSYYLETQIASKYHFVCFTGNSFSFKWRSMPDKPCLKV